MRPYELLFILRPDLDDEAADAAVERVTGVIEQNGGQLDEVSRWGKRRLAYELNGFRDGNYTVVTFQMEPGTTQEIERLLEINEDVMRYIIVRLDEK